MTAGDPATEAFGALAEGRWADARDAFERYGAPPPSTPLGERIGTEVYDQP